MTVARLGFTWAMLLGAAIALSACSTGTADGESAAPRTSRQSDSTEATAGGGSGDASATPVPPPAAGEKPTCENVLTGASYSDLEAAEMDFLGEEHASEPVAVRIRDAGGLTCAWGMKNSDVILTVGVLAATKWSTWNADLTAEGWTPSADNPGALEMMDEVSGFPSTVLERDGQVTYANNPVALEMIAALAG